MSDERIDLLRRALDQTGGLIAAVTPDQRSLPTPCAGWDVATLVGHVIGGLDNFTATARGEKPDWAAGRPPLEGDWAEAFRTHAATLVETWEAAPEERRPQVGMQITEQSVHAWDIAAATGRLDRLDPALAEQALAWSRPVLKPEYRGAAGGGAIGEEVPVAEDAPAYERLAGWFGRDPAPWRRG